jgi:hypothetical protein
LPYRSIFAYTSYGWTESGIREKPVMSHRLRAGGQGGKS